MKIVELEILLANYANAKDISTFTVRPDVDELPDGENGDIRITRNDNHLHLYHNGWQDLGAFEDERMEKVDQIIEDIQDIDMGNYIKKEESKEVISDLIGEVFTPMTDEDIDNILNGGA